MKTFNALSIFLLTINLSLSQNADDVLRFSLSENFSTARVNGLGGSFGALGGSSGGILINPASLAIFRTDELSFTLSNHSENIESIFLENSNSSERDKFSIQNLSYVKNLNIDSDWNRLNMAITWNRNNDLNRQFYMQGFNENNSMINNYFLEEAQNTPDSLLNYFDGTASAYWTDLIDLTNPNSGENQYFSNLDQPGQMQSLSINETGYINELGFACSGAYKDLVFVGLSLNFLDLDFLKQTSYSETDFENNTNIESFTYNTDLHITGEGTNFKIGTIFKPISNLRLGLAYHSRNYYSLYEEYTSDMVVNYSNGQAIDYFDPNLDGLRDFETEYYNIYSPAKTISSIALVISKKGLITIDYESINYGSGKFEDRFKFNEENQTIINEFTTATNIKAGLEWKFNNIAVRSGYAILGSPYKNQETGQREYISTGIGIQNGQYFIDLSYIQFIEESYFEYNKLSSMLNTSSSRVLISCNYKF
ncbi:MAG: hypothetical protein CMP65_00540 [Flavobacteriales bacterium]|nr:hypothetical protein [Flavobacteriales bacterium]|tara:strand:+ start:13025 stop:14464 length:1440 start_codon:yes stop_codon:yes gene_type:complete